MTKNMRNILAMIHFGLDPIRSCPSLERDKVRQAARRRVIERLKELYAVKMERGRLVVTRFGYRVLEASK